MNKRINGPLRYFLSGVFLILAACGGPSEQEMLLNAKSHLDKGDLKAASIELRNTLQENADNAEARFLLGSISMQLGDLESAEKEFRRAATAGWKNEDVQIEIARVLLAQREFQKLLDEVEAGEDWSPTARANMLGIRALAQALQGDVAAARKSLEEGSTFDSNAFHLFKSTATLQLAEIAPGDSKATLEKALANYPDDPELLLLYANAQQQENLLDEAEATYQKIIDQDAFSVITMNERRAYIGLARLYLIDNKRDLAQQILTPLLKRNNNDPEANYFSGLLAFENKNYSAAEDHIRKLLKMAPDHLQSQQLMGKIKYAVGDYDQAAQYLSAYLLRRSEDLPVRKLLASTYLELHQPELARSTLQDALLNETVDTGVLLLLSNIEFNEGNTEAGIEPLQKAIDANPGSPALRKQLAIAYIAIGKTQQALRELETFSELATDKQEAHNLMLATYLKSNMHREAIELATAMLEATPNDPAILAINGQVHAASGDLQQARNYFEQARQLEPGQLSASLGLADIEHQQGNVDKSIAIYEEIVLSGKGGTTPMLAIAEIFEQQGDIDKMLDWLEKARESAPDDLRSRNILANYYLSTQQNNKADTVIKEIKALAPDSPETMALLGKLLFAQKRYNEALPPLKSLVENAPDSTYARSLLGETYARLGMVDEAHAHLGKALSSNPDNALALGLMAEIELQRGDSDKSMTYAKRLQKNRPDLYQGHKLEGDVWLKRKEFNKASTAYEKAWEKQQTATLAKAMYRANISSSTPEDALEPALAWLQNNPEDTATRFFVATAYLENDLTDAATREYEKILEHAPENAAVLNNLAWLYSKNNDPRAVQIAKKAYQSTPENPGIQDTYGWILVQNGQAEKGTRLLSQALDQLPDNADVRYHYAAALIQSGKIGEGSRLLEKLLAEGKPFSGQADAERLLAKYKASR